jgi:Fe-S-cluster containining protein
VNFPDLRYQCVHCGYSCQDLEVELTRTEYETLLETVDPQAAVQKGDRYWLRKQQCGSCHFLLSEGEGRCSLHRSHGMAAKPQPCLEFPFRALATPGGVFVGASFACRAIATRQGPPLSAESVVVRTLELPACPLARGLDFDWPRYLDWEARVDRLLREQGPTGLWSAALETSVEVLGGNARQPSPAMEGELKAVFRGLLALAEGPMDSDELLAFLQAHLEESTYASRIVGGPVDVGNVLGRWEEPWSLWPEVVPFFEHLLFRKYLLEGPDVHSRICSLPIMAQILEFLVLAKTPEQAGPDDVTWALRILEERLTFHARGLERYLDRCGRAFLEGLL